MPSFHKSAPAGFTLIELLTATAILATLIAAGAPMMRDLMTSQKLAANANQLLAMIYTARAEGAYRSDMMICSAQGNCSAFDEPDNHLILVADRNSNDIRDSSDEIINHLNLPPEMTVQWRSFRGLPSLRINRYGVAYYQNGHFLLCYRGKARKVILNFQAKARVSSNASTKNCPAPDKPI